MECPNIHIISPQIVALLFYANEYLITADEHYQRIATGFKLLFLSYDPHLFAQSYMVSSYYIILNKQ